MMDHSHRHLRPTENGQEQWLNSLNPTPSLCSNISVIPPKKAPSNWSELDDILIFVKCQQVQSYSYYSPKI